MSRYRKNSHLLRDRDAETQSKLLGQDIFTLERESPSPFDSPSPVHHVDHAHLSPLNQANPFLDAADLDADIIEANEPMGAFMSTAPIPMTKLPLSHPSPIPAYDTRPADYGASSSTMTSSLGLINLQSNNARVQKQKRSQPHSQTHTQPRLSNIKETAKSNKQPFSSSRLNPSNMNIATYPLPVISTSYTYSSGSSVSSTASPSSSSTNSSTSTATTSTTATSASDSTSDSLTSVVKRRPSPFPLGPVPPPPPPRRKHNEVKPHIVDIAVETFQLDTQTVSKPKPLTASMRRRLPPPRLESYEDEEVMVPTPVNTKPYSLEITPAYARRKRNESESSNAPSAPKSAIQLEREALWKQFETEQIRSPDFTSTKRTSRLCQEKSITTAPITTFSTVTATTTVDTYQSKPSEKKSEQPAKKSKRKWWSCFGGGGVESDQEVVNEKR